MQRVSPSTDDLKVSVRVDLFDRLSAPVRRVGCLLERTLAATADASIWGVLNCLLGSTRGARPAN